jgi:hypothetical protein
MTSPSATGRFTGRKATSPTERLVGLNHASGPFSGRKKLNCCRARAVNRGLISGKYAGAPPDARFVVTTSLRFGWPYTTTSSLPSAMTPAPKT